MTTRARSLQRVLKAFKCLFFVYSLVFRVYLYHGDWFCGVKPQEPHAFTHPLRAICAPSIRLDGHMIYAKGIVIFGSDTSNIPDILARTKKLLLYFVYLGYSTAFWSTCDTVSCDNVHPSACRGMAQPRRNEPTRSACS